MTERVFWERPPGLHWQQVRRARGLTMPLPPEPMRPNRPPAPFTFRDVDIRTQADAEEASGSWDAFLDDVADLYVGGGFSRLLPEVERLVPQADLEAHREDLRLRIEALQEANLGHLRDVIDAAARPRRGLFARIFRRAS